jgi:bla regulator protein BlaR1
MIASVMIYGATIAAIVAVAALAIEHSCTVLRCPRRVVWMLALALSVALPIASISMKQERPAPEAPAESASYTPPAARPDNHATSIETISSSIEAVSSAIQQPLGPTRPTLDAILKALWIASSIGVISFYGLGWARLQNAARTWSRENVDGHAVFVADQLGPAVVGFLKPEIVLPRWLLTAPPSTRAMVLAHERAHIAARDPLVMIVALLLTALAPWNLALLWQLRRLRFAIEVDCDARVLREGVAASAYGEILLAVGIHNSEMPRVAIALTEPVSQLERRIRAMGSKIYWHSRLTATACAFLSVALVLCCTQVSVPAAASQVDETQALAVSTSDQIAKQRVEQQKPRTAVPFDPRQFDRFVGYYKLAGVEAFFTVSRQGDHFFARLTGQGDVEWYPESPTKFFARIIPAQISFVADAQGKTTGLILHQNGLEQPASKVDGAVAKAGESALTQRIKNNTPDPRREPPLRRFIDALTKGQQDLDDMSPVLVAASNGQWPKIQKDFQGAGTLKSLEFKNVTRQGIDVYAATFDENKTMTFRIGPLNSNQKMVTLLIQPGTIAANALQVAETRNLEMIHYKSNEWNFELDVPKNWNRFPPVSSNSPFEVTRFLSNESSHPGLIIFRSPNDPKAAPQARIDGTKQVLAKAGFSNFVQSETKIGSKVLMTLDFDKVTDGVPRYSRQFFIADGTLLYVLGFGTTDREVTFPLFDRIAGSFVTNGEPSKEASATLVPPANAPLAPLHSTGLHRTTPDLPQGSVRVLPRWARDTNPPPPIFPPKEWGVRDLGTAYMTAIVERDGSVKVAIDKSSGHADVDEFCQSLITTPQWLPGTVNRVPQAMALSFSCASPLP